MNKDFYIIGAGSVGGHIASNLDLYGLGNRKIFFLDNDKYKIGTFYAGYEVIDHEDSLLNAHKPVDVFIGVAFPKIKHQIYKKLCSNKNLLFPSLLAKNAWVSKGVEIGKGSIIYPNSSINYGSKIGDFVSINMNCAIGHHVSINDFSSLAPGVNCGGNSKLGIGIEMGIGSSCLQGIQIGDYSIIAGQAMVTKSFPNNSKVIGIPGKSKF